MIEVQSNIAELVDRLRARPHQAAIARADRRRQDLASGLHPWRSAATLWPNFGQD